MSSICYGRNEAGQGLSVYSYENTLREFLSRYSRKPASTKKGMMGELLAHLVIDKVLPNLQKITILFNKEERSIRKGFDLTYIEIEGDVIWYGEVKSGEVNNRETPSEKNVALLQLSKSGMSTFLEGHRENLWHSVITDVSLSLAAGQHKKVKTLLDSDLQEIRDEGAQKSAILISVLFHDVNNPIADAEVRSCLESIIAENRFAGVVTFSIQKSTYTSIEDFLNEEVAVE